MRNCIVNFHAIYNTRFGEEIYIVGNHHQLGQWDFSRALKMVTDKQSYPKWKSVKRIRINQGYEIEFKICFFMNNQFKSWENFPIGQNRKFKIDCRGITLLIIQNNQALIEQKRFDNFSSKQLFPLQVRKYTSVVQDELQSEQSSSSSGYYDYYEKQSTTTIQQSPQHDVKSLLSTFRYILSQGLFKLKSNLIGLNAIDLSKINPEYLNLQKRNSIYYFNNLNNQLISNQEKYQNPSIIKIGFQNCHDWETFSSHISKQIYQKYSKSINFLQSTLIFFGIQFGLIPKTLKKLFNFYQNLKIILQIDNFNFLNNLALPFDHTHLIQSIMMVDYLGFTNHNIFDQFLYFIEKQGFSVNLKYININQYAIWINQKIMFIKIQNYRDQQNKFKKEIQILSLKEQICSPKFDQIIQEYKKCQNKKVLIFSFGQYQNFEVLIKNKDVLQRLSNSVLIYVFTPNKLKLFTQVIQIFPKIVFISFTFLQMAYNRQIFYLLGSSQSNIFDINFLNEINQSISYFPNIKFTLNRNVINIKLLQNNQLSLQTFQQIYQQLTQLVNYTNQKNQQSLLLTRINNSVIQIKQIYQTQLFFTNLIFKNSQISVDFLILIMVDRFQHFQFLHNLKQLIVQKKSHYFDNTNFFCYTTTKNLKKNDSNCLDQEQLSKLLNLIFKIHSEKYFNQKMLNSKLIDKIKLGK